MTGPSWYIPGKKIIPYKRTRKGSSWSAGFSLRHCTTYTKRLKAAKESTMCNKPTFNIIAGTKEGDRAATHKMASHITNRLLHPPLEAGTKDWEEWAIENDIQCCITTTKENQK